jgi:oligosaccharide repeat unit polymerase
VTAIWTLTRPSFSIFFAAITMAMLLFVVIPATAAQFYDQTTLAGNNYGAGLDSAYRISALAQCGMLIGAIGTRTFRRIPGFIRIAPELSSRQIDRVSWLAVAAGAGSAVAFSALGGANLRDFFAYTTTAGYGTFGREGSGNLSFLIAVQCVGGLAIVLLPLRVGCASQGSWRKPVMTTLLATAVLVGGGQRAMLFVPAIAAGFLWVKTSKRDIYRRLIVVIGAIVLILLGGIIGIARGAANSRSYTMSNVLSAPFGSGNNLFLPVAGLAMVVPHETSYLYGSSYLQVLLFPIPRGLWHSKPTADISTVMDVIDSTKSGLAFPEFGEMYANFGLPGVVVGSMLLGIAVELLAARFASSASIRESVFIAVASAVILELFTRGSLAPMLTTFLGLLLSVGVVCRRRSRVLAMVDARGRSQDSVLPGTRWPAITE